MTIQVPPRLAQVLETVAAKICRFRDRRIGEQNTKASLIEPVLEALGWDVRDPDEVQREFRCRGRDCPVDYALTLLKKPRLYLEAKGLGEDLTDRRWVTQVLSYSTVAGVEWCVLSDGDEYRFYNAAAPVEADEKMFCRLRISEIRDDHILHALTMISRDNMAENLPSVVWQAHFVDRKVKEALNTIISEPAASLLRVIRKQEPKLRPKEILESLRRLDIHIESPAVFSEVGVRVDGHARPKGSKANRKAARVNFDVQLADLIGAGLLTPPLTLYRKYKGQMMEARMLADGGVEFQGTRYNTLSTAAEAARKTITGRRMHTNGWSFWHTRDGDGRLHELTATRAAYMAKRQ